MTTEISDVYGPIIHPPPAGPPRPALERTGAAAAFLLGLLALLATACGLVFFAVLTLPISAAAWALSAYAAGRTRGVWHVVAELGRWYAVAATSFIGVAALSMFLHGYDG